MVEYVEEERRCLSIVFSHLEAGDEGTYVCRASLQSTRRKEMLVKRESFQLTLYKYTPEKTTENNTGKLHR